MGWKNSIILTNLENQMCKILQNMSYFNYMGFVYLATVLIIRKFQMLEIHSLLEYPNLLLKMFSTTVILNKTMNKTTTKTTKQQIDSNNE